MVVMVVSVMVFIMVGVYILGSAGDDLSCEDFTETASVTVHITSPTYVTERGSSLTARTYAQVASIYQNTLIPSCNSCHDTVEAACGGTGQPACNTELAADSPLRDLYSRTTTVQSGWYDTCIAGQNNAQNGWGILVLISIVIAAVAIIGATRMLDLW